MYAIHQTISKTIYGEVYKARDKEGRTVALKFSRASDGLTRGENPLGEISILEELSRSSMEHQGQQYIIHLHDKFSTVLDGATYYCTALEFAEGGDFLEKILKLSNERRHLGFSQIRRYFTMLAQGLSFIHENGISHLDISLENILVTKSDELRICDFGQSEKKRMIQDTGLRRGKLKYMSPEVYQVLKYDGYKADVWSLGVVLWGMITGGLIYRKPILSDPRFVLLTKGQAGLKELLQSDEVQDVSPSLLHLLSKMLDINVETRYLIQDVLSHPWVWAVSGTSKTFEFPSQEEEKKVPSTPLSPPRVLRQQKTISATPTAKIETYAERKETRPSSTTEEGTQEEARSLLSSPTTTSEKDCSLKLSSSSSSNHTPQPPPAQRSSMIPLSRSKSGKLLEGESPRSS